MCFFEELLVLDDDQQKVLVETKTPLMLIGPSGSRKTMIGSLLLLQKIEEYANRSEESKILFLVKSARVAEAVDKWLCENQQTISDIEKVRVDLMWENFSEVTALRRLTPGPFLTNHAKHLINIAFGNLPSLAPTFTSQNIAPIEGLQNSIMNIYGLNNNIPIIMTIREHKVKLPVYYPLSFPTILEGSPINKTHTTLVEALRALKILIDNFQKYNKINKTEENLLNQIIFEYIHTGQDPSKELLNSVELINKLDFIKYKQLFPNLTFPYASYFWNGCIRVAFKD